MGSGVNNIAASVDIKDAKYVSAKHPGVVITGASFINAGNVV